MKKIVIIALSVLLATAIISNIASYRRYRDTKTAFERSEKKAVYLKEKIDKLEQQISVFEDQIRENAKKLEELGVAKTRVSELGSMISMKNQSLLEYQEKISELESNYRAEKKITENLRAEISSKTTKIHKLEDRVRSADTQVLSFTEQLTRSRYETEGLLGQVSGLSDQKSALEVTLRQQKSAHETDVARFKVEIQSREARIGALQGQHERAKSEILSLKDQLEIDRTEIEGLKGELSSLVKGKNELEAELKQLKSTHSAIVAKLGEEVQNRDAMIGDLQKGYEDVKTQLLSLTHQLTQSRGEIEGLQGQVSDLSALKIALETKGAQQKSSHETTVAGLIKEIQNREARIGELQGKLERAKAQIVSLRDQLEKERVGIAKLQRNLLETQRLRARLNESIDQMKSTYVSIVNGLKEQIENREVIISELGEKLSVTFVDRILFQSGKATVTPKGKEILTKVGQILRNVKSKRIRVEGHTDNKLILPEYRHKFPSNWELSAARAAAVVRYFQNEVGFDPSNLEATGHSFYKPIAPNETEEGRAQNRRVNIIIAPTFE